MSKKAASADEHEHIDGCLCNVKLGESELISDADLPGSKGGIEKNSRKSNSQVRKKDGSNEIDGCDLDFTADPPTGDQDLPAAKGGIV